MKLKNKILPLLLLASTAVGCTDGFETINSDPNKLYEVNLQSIFPGTVYKTMNAIVTLLTSLSRHRGTKGETDSTVSFM